MNDREKEFFHKTRGLVPTLYHRPKTFRPPPSSTPVYCWKCERDLTKNPRAKLFRDHYYCPDCGETTNILLKIKRR